MPRLLEPFPYCARPLERFVQLVTADKHVGDHAIGRIVHPAAETQFLFIKSREIVLGRVLQRIVVLLKSLQNICAGSLPATLSSLNLVEQLEIALGGAKFIQT